MGTNFYLHAPEANKCDHCGRSDPGEVLHIGKSSAGWVFALHVIPERGITDLDDWRALWAAGTIKNEYGDVLTPEEMELTITERGRPRDWDAEWWRPAQLYASEMHFHQRNYSERGPNGLLRHQIDGRHCIKHGAGTWDCMPGEFS